MTKKPIIISLAVTAAALVLALLLPSEINMALPYDRYALFHFGLVSAENEHCKWGFIDEFGREMIPFEYDEVREFDEYGVAVARKGKEYYMLDTQEWHIGNAAYSFVDTVNCKPGTYIVKNDGKAGIVDSQGKYVLAPEYDDLDGFESGFARVCIDGKWGFMNEDYEIVIPCKFDKEYWFGIPECTSAAVNDRWGVIDSKGDWIIEPQYDRVIALDSTEYFEAYQGGYYFYIDRQNIIVSNKYESFLDLDKERPFTLNREEETYPEPEYKYPELKDYTVNNEGSISKVYNEKGEEIFSTEGYIYNFTTDGYAQFYTDWWKCGIIDRFGNVVVPPTYYGISDMNWDGL
ncbi:MAG: WG repeat-containing protein [Ruminococcus sp.]|nr:WG repeat-containing protein [Ruminococcus sp.]